MILKFGPDIPDFCFIDDISNLGDRPIHTLTDEVVPSLKRGRQLEELCNTISLSCCCFYRRAIISHLMASSEWMPEAQRLYSTVSCINSATIGSEKCRSD